tara:strand:+ start:1657 stop:2385 length:729 start_codon:yes stop_codon:yes gene_type:complete
MFFIFKKRNPKLFEIIPSGFTDIHSHILPGLDDGAQNLNESKNLISGIQKLGFSKIIATPHNYPGLYENTNEIIKESFDTLQKKINVKIKVNYASEYMIDSSLIEKSEKKSLLTIKKDYVLVEMSYIASPNNLHDIIFKLRTNDYVPILAHPERYNFLHKNFDEYLKLKDIGCLFQLNLLSTTGYYGYDVLKTSNLLLNKKLIDFVGSDIHRDKHIKEFYNNVKIKEIKELEKVIDKNSFFR